MSSGVVSELKPLRRSRTFRRPYVCIPAKATEGEFLVLVDPGDWDRSLMHHGLDVMKATEAVLRRAQAYGRRMVFNGERALLVS